VIEIASTGKECFGAEVDFLLASIRTAAGLNEAMTIQACSENSIEWPSLLARANNHGLAPLLHRYLDNFAHQNNAPQNIRQTLLHDFRINGVLTLSMSNELCRIHSRFKKAGIPLVPIKGPTFGKYVYGNSCFRPFCDLDFLIKKQHVMQAKAIFLADGFQPQYPLDRKQEIALLRHECEYPFYHHGKDLLAEIHWKLVPEYGSFGFSSDEIWEHLIPFEFFGLQMMIPSPEYMLLILIIHNGGKHQWERLLWILDIAQLIQSCKQMHWTEVMGIAAQKGMSRALGLGLYMAHDLFAVELPQSILAGIHEDKRIKILAGKVYQRLFAHPQSPPSKLEHLRFSLEMRNRPMDKFRYCLSQFTMSDIEDRRRVNLPEPLTPVYGLMRLARWLTN
jgi:hypothetical protein